MNNLDLKDLVILDVLEYNDLEYVTKMIKQIKKEYDKENEKS